MLLLFLLLLIPSIIFSETLYISEVMSNPIASSDSEGEYIELYNPTVENFRNTIQLVINHDTIFIDSIYIPAKSYFLLCRQNSPLACSDHSTFSLLNSKENQITIQSVNAIIDSITTLSKPGVSYQRNFNALDHQLEPTPESYHYNTYDIGTPGYGNPEFNGNILDYKASFSSTIDTNQTLHIQLDITPKPPFITIANDADFDMKPGLPTWQMDYSPSIQIQHEHINNNSILMLILPDDDFPLNNRHYILPTPNHLNHLRISEIFPFPDTFHKEWIELTNHGIKPIDLSRFNILANGKTSRISNSVKLLNPGTRIILAQDSLNFTNNYYNTPQIVPISPWPYLSNDGSNIQITHSSGQLIDSTSYQNHSVYGSKNKNISLKRIHYTSQWLIDSTHSKGSPGYTGSDKKIIPDLKFSKRVYSKNENELIKVKILIPEFTPGTFYIYDIHGKELFVKKLSSSGLIEIPIKNIWNSRLFIARLEIPDHKPLLKTFVIKP